MDGNGRWAKAQGKARTVGHKKGVEVARDIVRYCGELGVASLTLFAFSSENWNRPEQEVGFLMRLFIQALQSEVKELHKNNVRLRFIGNRTRLDSSLQEGMAKAETRTQNNTGLIFNVAVSYGGRWDIVNAVRKISDKEHITEMDISNATETAGQNDVDLFIRSGGEKRISNFLLWQLSYAELHFTDVLWPDFSQQHLHQAIKDFSSRQRRFGKTAEQLEMEKLNHNNTEDQAC
ncbi:MAG: di-trans,poly-cis-decaprenylcistransferase [Gammaproteobacteria bacterium]|nr:di-trans,poly-cis-decaprenylcistransferase [Gammaproteobacteria bacterium]NNC97833.1 di-trans,poly-cis-decaprenylcistransferase [Gammaproteobacteria bacterium]NNM13706.1 di-trans,poly-cis-decaprenylcistransferase [Gammaproteobacteria bacterium]